MKNLNPNSEVGIGSARGPRADLGGPAQIFVLHFLSHFPGPENLWNEVFGEPPKTARQRRALPTTLNFNFGIRVKMNPEIKTLTNL